MDARIYFVIQIPNKSEVHVDQGMFCVLSAGKSPLLPYCSFHLNKVFMDAFMLLREGHNSRYTCWGG